jgi:hypothetical protein
VFLFLDVSWALLRTGWSLCIFVVYTRLCNVWPVIRIQRGRVKGFTSIFPAGKVRPSKAQRRLSLALRLAPAWCFPGSPRRRDAHLQANSILVRAASLSSS